MDPKAPPGAWTPARRVALSMLRPIERFLSIEAASGGVLLVCTAVALLCANSRLAPYYEALWHTPITVGVGSAIVSRSLHFVIDDGLMTIFFFVVGLEIRREIHQGELSERKRAMLPLLAAVGGMIVPAAIFSVLNVGSPLARGWGVPMATDIAFAVGVLAVLGKRVPPALRVLLLALAIIDDVGAILVIAIFYSRGVGVEWLALAAAGAAVIVGFQWVGFRRPYLYAPAALLIWFGLYRAGIHPTLAGVVVGLMTPVRAWPGREAEPPVTTLASALHPWVAFGIMPLFALANAGVSLRGGALADPQTRWMAIGIVAGLFLGKPLGIVLASHLGTKLGITALPRGVTLRGVLLVGMVGGIGFTMAIFIANLAFATQELLDTAKLAILVASAAAGIAGALAGRLLLPPAHAPDAAKTAEDAEQSTEY